MIKSHDFPNQITPPELTLLLHKDHSILIKLVGFIFIFCGIFVYQNNNSDFSKLMIYSIGLISLALGLYFLLAYKLIEINQFTHEIIVRKAISSEITLHKQVDTYDHYHYLVVTELFEGLEKSYQLILKNKPEEEDFYCIKGFRLLSYTNKEQAISRAAYLSSITNTELYLDFLERNES